MNSNKINQKEYLKKYLMSDAKKKKKKMKKEKSMPNSTIKIVDDDVDLSQLSHVAESELDNYTLGEDLPQIAGIIDERPADLIAKEDYKTNGKWKSFENDESFNSSKIHSKGSLDASPPRRSKDIIRSSNASLPRRSKDINRSLADSSPRRSIQSASSSHRKHSNRSSDESPSRRSTTINRSLTDSPPRRSIQSASSSHPKHSNRSSDESPPRRSKRSLDASPPRRSKDVNRRFDASSPRGNLKRRLNAARDTSKSPPPTHKKSAKTLDGKNAGLQNAKALREENEQFRKREDEIFRQMHNSAQQTNENVIGGRKTGRCRRLHEDDQKDRDKSKKAEERKKIYDRWGKGLKQIEDFKKQVVTETHEMNKPIARYANDEDLEDYLRSQCRDGDPMASYFRKKANESQSGPSKPIYQGSFPENRFNIRPGYRWDGVDRSNGYEKKWFEVLNQKKAVEEEAYKYSVEDM